MSNPVLKNQLNPIQLHLLKMFAFNRQNLSLEELKSVLLEFYQKKVDEEADKIWDEKNLNDEKLEELLNFHKRTPYK
jgi:hypothetical protein